MRKPTVCLALGLTLNCFAAAYAAMDDPSFPKSLSEPQGIRQVIVQIGGRFCEYHRTDVERALRGYPGVRGIEFLNNHGTVLVRYEADGGLPGRLAESVEQALAMGVGCKAWVDRGRHS